MRIEKSYRKSVAGSSVIMLFRQLALYIRIFGPLGTPAAVIAAVRGNRSVHKVSTRWTKNPVFIRPGSSDISVFRQIFLKEEYGIVKSAAESFGTIIDAGSNVGLTSIYLADRYPNAKILSIEPDSDNYQLLVLNTRAYDNICCKRGAVWNKDGWIRIIHPNAKSWAFRVEDTDSTDNRAIPAFRLSTLMHEHDIERVALLKMDIEGAEWEVLGDADWWIDYVDNIVIELHEAIRPGCTARFNNVTSSFGVVAEGRELTLVSRMSSH